MTTQALVAFVGVWLMAAPAVLGHGDPAATQDRIFGPTIAALAIVAMAQVTRPVRWLNVPLGLWMAAAPFVLSYSGAPRFNDAAAGVAIAALSAVRGRITERYGGGWSSLARDAKGRSR